MVKKYNDFDPQLESAVLTDKAKLSLYKKSVKSGIPANILEEVYQRGINTWNPTFGYSPEQFGFDRVNSFIAGGFAVELDEDLKKACWKGYEAIGMKMKNGKKVPNCVPVKEEDAEKHSTNPDEPASRFIGSDELVTIYKSQTPGQIIKKVVREHLEEAAMQAAQAPAPTAADMSPTRLGGARTAPTYQASTIGNQGLNRTAPNTYRATSQVTPSGLRSMRSSTATPTSRLAPSSGPTLKPTSVNAPKTAASAPTSTPKPSASFGSSSRPTTVSATSGGMEKSGGYKLSSGMSDSAKVKLKPTAPVEIPATAGKAASVLGKVAKFAGPVGAVAGLVADAKPLNKGEDELGRQKSLGISKPNVTPGMGSTKNIEPVKGGAITTKAPDYYKGKVGDYTVKAGDTLSGIASRTGQSVADLASKNKFDSENKIAAGAKLFTGSVPTPPSRPETESGVRKKIRECIEEATYKGKKVPLNKPMKGDVKKSKVYVDPDGDGKAQKVNFGDKTLSIKKNIPARKKSYCARSSGQGNLTDKTSANYWSRRAWNCEETEVNEISASPHYKQKLKRDEPLSIMQRNDPLEQRKGKESTRNQYQREFPADYAKKKIAKGNLTPKDEIKAILGKHTKPNLPEHVEETEQ